MLHYLYDVTYHLFITVTVLMLFFALCKTLDGRTGFRIELGGMAVGIAAALVRAISKATITIYDVEINLYTFYVGLIAMILMLIATPLFCKKRAALSGKAVVCSLAAVISVDLLLYKAWNVLDAFRKFTSAGESVLSADFMLKLAGWILTMILFAVYVRFLYRCLMRLSEDRALWVDEQGIDRPDRSLALLGGASFLSVGCLLVNYAGQILRIWRQASSRRVRDPETRRRIQLIIYRYRPDWFKAPKSGSAYDTWEGDFARFIGNNTGLFMILIGVIVMIPLIILFVRSLQKRGRYSNPAQHRRLKANRRHNRRWVAVAAVCLVLVTLNLTVVHAIDTKVEDVPDSETYTVSEDGTQVLIPIDQVNDFNLHAFEMLSNGTTVRWIVVRKPNSGAYGVGLDACEVCGTAGYIQRGDTVVCKKCDVVMNTNTIGLKGGCNPIPLNFTVENGQLIIQMADLVAAEKEFK